MKFRNLLEITILFLLLTSSSCTKSNKESDRYRNSVNVRQNPNPYYYQRPSYNPPGYHPYVQNAAPPPQQQYYYQQPPIYQPPPAPYGGTPGSRFYSNPYAIPPSTQHQRFDADQYYVPPTRYRNIESQAPSEWAGSSGR